MGAESLLKITPYLREPVLLYQSTSFRYYALKIQNTKLQSQLDDLTLHKEVLLVQPDILQRRLSNSNSSSKPSSLSDHQYQDYQETFQTIPKISRLYRNFPAYSGTFQAIQKLSTLSGNFPDHPKNIQPIRKLSRLSGNFPASPKNIQTIWKLSRLSGNL